MDNIEELDDVVKNGLDKFQPVDTAGTDIKKMSNADLDALLAQIKSGALDLEALRRIKQAVRPRSDSSIEKDKAIAALETFLSTPLSDLYELTQSVGEVFKDIEELQAEIKKHAASRTKHSTQTLRQADYKDLFFKVSEDETLNFNDSGLDSKNKKRMIELGYTEGQWNAVTKYRRSLV